MAAEDEHLAYGNDEDVEEKSNRDPCKSPQSQVEGPYGNPQLEGLKEQEIIDACRRRDIEALQALADSPGGFISDELRQQACELCDDLSTKHSYTYQGTNDSLLTTHRAHTARTTSPVPKRRQREGI